MIKLGYADIKIKKQLDKLESKDKEFFEHIKML